jgi:hypothetical protein
VEITGLPGFDMVARGIEDLAAGRETVEALLVAVGAVRLRRGGLPVPRHHFDHPEHRLYTLVAASSGDAAHSRYNALIRRLVSFERALECES